METLVCFSVCWCRTSWLPPVLNRLCSSAYRFEHKFLGEPKFLVYLGKYLRMVLLGRCIHNLELILFFPVSLNNFSFVWFTNRSTRIFSSLLVVVMIFSNQHILRGL